MPNRTLPPDVWDRLAATAAAVGGVSQGRMFESRIGSVFESTDPTQCPVCLIGVAVACGLIPLSQVQAFGYGDGIVRVSQSVASDYAISLFGGHGWPTYDDAIQATKKRLGLPSSGNARVPFEEVMQEMGITRGEEVASA